MRSATGLPLAMGHEFYIEIYCSCYVTLTFIGLVTFTKPLATYFPLISTGLHKQFAPTISIDGRLPSDPNLLQGCPRHMAGESISSNGRIRGYEGWVNQLCIARVGITNHA